MRYLFTIIFTAIFSTALVAQAHIGTVEYLKVQRQAIMADFPFPPKMVMNTIEEKLERMGYKGKDAKDFTVFRGASISELGAGVYDLYFMVEKKSKKDRDNSVVTLMISKGYENFVTDAEDAVLMGNAKSYVESLRTAVAAFDLEEQIKEQEELVRKNEKKAAKLVEDGADLDAKLRKIQELITDNKKGQETQKDELEKQRVILETLKARRKG